MSATMQNLSEPTTRRMLVGIWKNLPSENSVVVFNDATANREDLEAMLGRPVIDITPEGHLANIKRVVQYPIDLTRHASAKRFLDVIRGILTEFPDARRVGVITQRTLMPALKKLAEPFAGRIVKSTYFGSGSDRASNEWHDRCDLIIVAGTPRVPGEVVQRRLCQLGNFDAAGHDGRWGEVRWRCWTESGKRLIVTGRGYDHDAWNRAHQSLVRAAIIQAAGRGRALLENGCDVVVVSTEWCGFDFADGNTDIELSEVEAKVLEVLADYGYTPLKDISKGLVSINSDSVSTGVIAQRMAMTRNGVQKILVRLESRRLVYRVGERGGWRLAAGGSRLVLS